MPSMPSGGPGADPSVSRPQELAGCQAQLRAQAQELRSAQARLEELLGALQGAQEQEAAATSHVQALSSQLDDAQVARSEVRPGVGRGEGRGCWRRAVPPATSRWPVENQGTGEGAAACTPA